VGPGTIGSRPFLRTSGEIRLRAAKVLIGHSLISVARIADESRVDNVRTDPDYCS
jgi:hypothetical protein